MPGVRPLSDAYAKVAKNDLNESPERIESSLVAIKLWLKQSPHILARNEDQFLVSFFRCCKYSLEKVKEKLDIYYTVRTKIYKDIASRNPLDEKTLSLLRTGFIVPLFLQKHSASNPAYFLMQVSNYDPNEVSGNDLFNYGVQAVDICLDDDKFTTCGVGIVFDYQNLTMAHVLQYTPLFIKQSVMIFQTSSPCRIKAIHFVNVAPAYLFVCNLLKSFLNQKLRNRVFVHKSLDDLLKSAPKEIMPHEYNGNAGPIKDMIRDWELCMLSKQHLLLNGDYGVDERKRHEKSKNCDFMTDGLEGSFRKISVD